MNDKFKEFLNIFNALASIGWCVAFNYQIHMKQPEKDDKIKTGITNIKNKVENAHINSSTLVLSPEEIAILQEDLSKIEAVLYKKSKEEIKTDSLNIELARAKRQIKNR